MRCTRTGGPREIHVVSETWAADITRDGLPFTLVRPSRASEEFVEELLDARTVRKSDPDTRAP